MFTLDLRSSRMFSEAVVAPHPPTGTYRARLVFRQPESLGAMLPTDGEGRIVEPVLSDADLRSLIAKLVRRFGEIYVDENLIAATINWIPMAQAS